jgi:hypothetical protein
MARGSTQVAAPTERGVTGRLQGQDAEKPPGVNRTAVVVSLDYVEAAPIDR